MKNGRKMRKMRKKFPLVTRIFAYIMLLLVLMSLAGVALFARQFVSFYREEQMRQLGATFQSVFRQLEGKTPAEITEIAQRWYSRNQSFNFVIEGGGGEVLFSTPGAEETILFGEAGETRSRAATRVMMRSLSPGEGETFTLKGAPGGFAAVDFGNLVGKSLIALGIMIALGALGALLFARTITKPLEDELARVRVMEENQRLFFSAASHELKTPIAATEALVEGMMANIGDYTNHPKYLRECMKTLDAQNRLVSEILEIVTLSDETAEPLLLPLDLGETAASLAAEYRPLAEQRGLEIQLDLQLEIPNRPPLTVRSDRNLLRRALSNVLANAVQNTPENGAVRISAEASGTTRGRDIVRLTVLNTGARIEEGARSRLFDPFYRPDPARARGGTCGGANRSGLGLTIVKKSLDRLNIPFGLENTEAGVVFWMELLADNK
jgi:two-component system sensor histidine kinase VanS